jgi:8-oxo-dGTP diphosphatase
MKPHRIAAGGIVIRDDAILLVRYGTGPESYLVGPGGAVEEAENIEQAIVRETLEETKITVRPRKVLWIEDIQCSRYKMSKTWMLCDAVVGEVRKTEGARAEGITEARWLSRTELADTVVFPSPIMQTDWRELESDGWQTICLPSRVAGF